MNEPANTQLVQSAYRGFQEQNIQAFLDTLAEDVRWELPEMPGVPFAGKRRGREAAGQFFSQLLELQDVLDFELEQFIAQDDTVVVLGHYTMHVKPTGKNFRSQWAHVWKIENGKAALVREYVDTLAVTQAHSE